MKGKMQPWGQYVRLYRGQYRKFLLSVALAILQSLVVIPITLLIRVVFDGVLPEKDFRRLVMVCAVIFGLFILNGALTLWTRHISLKTTKRVITHIRDSIVAKIYALPRQYFTETDRMTLHACIVQDTFRLDVMSNALVAQLLPSLLVSSGLCLVLLHLDPPLFLVAMAIAPLLVFFGKQVARALREKVNAYHRHFEAFSKRVMVLLNHIDLTRASVCEANEIREQGRLHEKLEKKGFDQAWFGAFYVLFNETATSASAMAIMIFGGYRVMQGSITIGKLFAFFAALGLLKKYLLTVSGVMPGIIEGMESLRSVFAFLNEERSLPYSGTGRLEFKGGIRFESVSFAHGRGKLLENISFALAPGKAVCIVGPNGSGKSTIVNLILGFYRPREGVIRAEGRAYEEIDLRDVRRSVGVVFQDAFVFPGSIRENVCYGSAGCSQERLEATLELAGCREFIAKLPEGLETYIENKHEKLSGGEFQRLAIARALLGDNKLIIMDEPSTHLDRCVMTNIIANLKTRRADISLLIISHDGEVAGSADEWVRIADSRSERTGRRGRQDAITG